ncbi:WbqC family protein [Duncaniella muris]|jgi:hypothetical protein|uniref:WbqC family protein n=1 Tax=Duncaniella muris TaxID=2094150 RepID=UPI0025B0BC88|nr:WbqC family protein [Duncaniella muris]
MSEAGRAVTVLLLPPMLCAPAEVYARIAALGGEARFDWSRRFDKRFKDSHRFAIADTRGRLELTVPIAKPQSSHCRWDEIRISDHGQWWDVHRVALESAYGRTPYFEFYIDRLLSMLTDGVCVRYPLLRDLAGAWDSWIRKTLELPAATDAESAPLTVCEAGPADREIVLPQYWQIRADKLGFISGLSVLDLIFNLGPEAVIYLDRL